MTDSRAGNPVSFSLGKLHTGPSRPMLAEGEGACVSTQKDLDNRPGYKGKAWLSAASPPDLPRLPLHLPAHLPRPLPKYFKSCENSTTAGKKKSFACNYVLHLHPLFCLWHGILMKVAGGGRTHCSKRQHAKAVRRRVEGRPLRPCAVFPYRMPAAELITPPQDLAYAPRLTNPFLYD